MMSRLASQKDLASWSLSTDFDTRTFGWEDNRDDDHDFLALFLAGKLPKTEATLDKYMRLYDRGLITTEDGQDKLNVILVKEQLNESGIVNYYDSALDKNIPDISSELSAQLQAMNQEKIDILKEYYPEHMHRLVAHYNQFQLNTVMILDELLATGKLRPLTEHQKKGVMTIIYRDALPAENVMM